MTSRRILTATEHPTITGVNDADEPGEVAEVDSIPATEAV